MLFLNEHFWHKINHVNNFCIFMLFSNKLYINIPISLMRIVHTHTHNEQMSELSNSQSPD